MWCSSKIHRSKGKLQHTLGTLQRTWPTNEPSSRSTPFSRNAVPVGFTGPNLGRRGRAYALLFSGYACYARLQEEQLAHPHLKIFHHFSPKSHPWEVSTQSYPLQSSLSFLSLVIPAGRCQHIQQAATPPFRPIVGNGLRWI